MTGVTGGAPQFTGGGAPRLVRRQEREGGPGPEEVGFRRAAGGPPRGRQVRVPGPSAPGPRGADLPGYSTGGRALLRPSALAKGCEGPRLSQHSAGPPLSLGLGQDLCVVPAAGIDRESDGRGPAGAPRLLPKLSEVGIFTPGPRPLCRLALPQTGPARGGGCDTRGSRD